MNSDQWLQMNYKRIGCYINKKSTVSVLRKKPNDRKGCLLIAVTAPEKMNGTNVIPIMSSAIVWLAIAASAIGCANDIEPAQLSGRTQALEVEAADAPDLDTSSVEGRGGEDVEDRSAAKPISAIDHAMDRGERVDFPQQVENRRLYRGREELGDFNAKKSKEEKPFAVRGAPPSSGTISGAEYGRRADIYLKRWAQEKDKVSHLTPTEQENEKAKMKREIVGE